MPHISDRPLTRISLRLYADDYQELKTIFGGELKVSKAIRDMISSYVAHARAKALAEIDALEPLDEEKLL